MDATSHRANNLSFQQRRAQRSDQIRRDLAEAGHRLFVARGFDEVTVGDIAKEAGVSRRTFFRYFPTKEAVAFPNNDELMDLFRAALLQETKGRPASLDELRVVLQAMAGVYIVNADRMAERRKFVDKSRALLSFEQMIFLGWQNVIAEGIDGTLFQNLDQGGSRTTFQARVIAGAIVGALIPTFWEWYEEGAKSDLAERATDVLASLDGGLSAMLSALEVARNGD